MQARRFVVAVANIRLKLKAIATDTSWARTSNGYFEPLVRPFLNYQPLSVFISLYQSLSVFISLYEILSVFISQIFISQIFISLYQSFKIFISLYQCFPNTYQPFSRVAGVRSPLRVGQIIT
jgi:hypothetical protein